MSDLMKMYRLRHLFEFVPQLLRFVLSEFRNTDPDQFFDIRKRLGLGYGDQGDLFRIPSRTFRCLLDLRFYFPVVFL